MNVITTALNDRPVKNRKLLPHPRSAPVLGRSNVKTPANERLYPMPSDPFPLTLPLSNPPMARLPIDNLLQDLWRAQTRSSGIATFHRVPSADWFSPTRLVPSSGPYSPRSTRVGRQVTRRTIPPLPEGEGWGEGERAPPIDCQSYQQLRNEPSIHWRTGNSRRRSQTSTAVNAP